MRPAPRGGEDGGDWRPGRERVRERSRLGIKFVEIGMLEEVEKVEERGDWAGKESVSARVWEAL